MTDCVFCRIVRGEAPSHPVWEDERHLAFLSLRPNTEGFTVVIPQAHHPSYAFDLPDEVLSALVLAAKRVGRLLDERLDDRERADDEELARLAARIRGDGPEAAPRR